MRDLSTTECGQDTATPTARTPNNASVAPTVPLNFVKSGQKVKSKHGFNAIKNGIKTRQYDEGPLLKKPDWLKIRPPAGDKYQSIKALVDKHSLSTVCQEAMCPNIAECWSSGTATLMLMGSVCTRACKFCAVDTGNPKGWLDKDEPAKVADAVSIMGLKYVVLTSVNRDDLEDGGAQHYADCVKAIKAACPDTAVEVLTPDFQGVEKDIALLLESGIEVFAQNIETVERLTHPIRDNRAGYQQTLSVLAFAKAHHPKILTKTSILLGMGETDDEILKTLEDLKAHQVDIVTLGQYMRPTLNHWPVSRYVSLEDFERYRQMGLAMGFLEVVSGPLVRSSYRAEQVLQKNNVGLD